MPLDSIERQISGVGSAGDFFILTSDNLIGCNITDQELLVPEYLKLKTQAIRNAGQVRVQE